MQQLLQCGIPTPNSPVSYSVRIGTPLFSATSPISCCPMSLISLYSRRRRTWAWMVSSGGWLYLHEHFWTACRRGGYRCVPQLGCLPINPCGCLEEGVEGGLGFGEGVALGDVRLVTDQTWQRQGRLRL
jgi:hypothetical protein